MALALPLLVIVLLEGVLRLAGYGYPTSFFLKHQQEGAPVLVENPKFGWRFFPPAVARSPQPLLFPAQKPVGAVRIFLFGESAAMGDPEPAYGFGRQLQRILQARHPLNPVEVINVAMTAINSHVIREIARDCAARQGDVWLIYAGNNEVVGPFGAGTVFGPQAASVATVRVALAAKSLRLVQFLADLLPNSNAPTQWEGMELFLHNQVTAQDARLTRVYDNFAANLTAVIHLGQRAGARIVLATVPVNLKDCPPFASAHRLNLSSVKLKAWEEQFGRGRQAESERRYAEALTAYQAAEQLDAEFAELAFRRATCELGLGQTDKAKSGFSRARDLDTLRFRADSRLNEIIHQAASATSLVLVDAEQELALHSRSGVPGAEQFYDHVHLNFAGNYLVATLFAAQVEKEVFPSASPAGPFVIEAEVAHQLAFTDFDRRRVGEEMRLRLQQPPFSAQSNFHDRDKQWQQTLSAPHPAPADSSWEYRAALALAPGDWVLRENFARLLEAIGDKAAASEQWAQVCEELPHEPEGYFHLGNLALDAGSYGEAAERFRTALERKPGSAEALSGLGLVLAAEGRTNAALVQFQAALKLNTRFSPARVNMAVLLAQCGGLSAAISEYQTVLRTDTNNVAARINLAKLWFSQGKTNEAIALYVEAIDLRPDNPIAQFDLGNALAAQGRHADALTHYAAAVDYQPSFADARYNLALELARQGKIIEALPQFSEAVRLRPTSIEAHFNYGVALAKVRRYGEAAQQFEATLKLQPSHPSARALLDRAVQLNSNHPLFP
jgi:tetratricopeptide (TPR) repeat protein